MFSDSLFEVIQEIWKAVHNYEYSDDFKSDIINAVTDLRYIQYQLDTPYQQNITQKKHIKKLVEKMWDRAVAAREISTQYDPDEDGLQILKPSMKPFSEHSTNL
jgi:hypothetical protein